MIKHGLNTTSHYEPSLIIIHIDPPSLSDVHSSCHSPSTSGWLVDLCLSKGFRMWFTIIKSGLWCALVVESLLPQILAVAAFLDDLLQVAMQHCLLCWSQDRRLSRVLVGSQDGLQGKSSNQRLSGKLELFSSKLTRKLKIIILFMFVGNPGKMVEILLPGYVYQRA